MERDGRWHPGLAVLLARKIDGMTQAALAEKVGMTQGQLSRLERMESAFTWEHMQTFSEAQARGLEWYVYGPSNAQRSDGAIPGYPKLNGVIPLNIGGISKSDEEYARDTWRPRKSAIPFGGVRNLAPRVLSFKVPKTLGWVDLELAG